MKETEPMPRIMAVAPGYIVGVLWLAMASSALWTSLRGYANSRLDWGLGWGIVGLFLLAAGVAALVGTWWHHNRVNRSH